MTDRPTDAEPPHAESELTRLEDADPADAPQIAEDLADRLTRKLDGSDPSPASDPEEPS